MNEPIRQAIMILLVGMTSVFFILSVVVLSANILIRVLNSYGLVLNEDTAAQAKDAIPKNLIRQAVAEWSGGKAVVKKITKK